MLACWPIPIDKRQFAQAAQVNPVLARAFRAMRFGLTGDESSAFFASPDDLLQRVDLPEFRQLIEFIAASLQETVKQANAQAWPSGRMSLRLEIVGCWFQIQNGQAFHDIHTHGNCSWSGIYYVQIDPPEKRVQQANMGEHNGATRFYGPYSQFLGGAHMDIGNAYLQKNTLDIQPEEGSLVLFPSYLPHKAMPYTGEKDRIVLSFNAQIHSSSGDKVYPYSAA
ncbi:MAG: TIGR02466 family protein [Burkholderiales bacterium]